jgi:hypothetical protein
MNRRIFFRRDFLELNDEGLVYEYRVVFVDSESNEICFIPKLTFAEARWIADSILKTGEGK